MPARPLAPGPLAPGPRHRPRPLCAALASALAAGLSLGACVTTHDDVAVAETQTRVRDVDTPAAPLSRALQDLDQRVDRYVFLASQPGEDARDERRMLGPALQALVGRHEAALVELAADPEEHHRRHVATKSLAFARSPRAVEVLSKLLESEPDPRLLTNAAYALSGIASPDTRTAPLVALVGHTDRDVVNNALVALWRVFDARRAAGRVTLPPAEAALALPLLELALFDLEDPLVRGNAAAAMGALGDSRAVDPLLNVLRDSHPLVRTQTALALGKLGDRRAVAPLVDAVDQSPSGTPRSAVSAAIALLLEKQGHIVSEPLPDSTRAWRAYVRRVAGS
jgi:HEAT repeat protein